MFMFNIETFLVPVTVEITPVNFACRYFTRDWRSITFCFRGRSGVAPGRMNPQGGVGQHGDFHQELHWNSAEGFELFDKGS